MDDANSPHKLKRQAYLAKASEFNQKATVNYMLLWDIGNLLPTDGCLPWRCLPQSWQRQPKQAVTLATARAELSELHGQVCDEVWKMWDADADGLSVQVVLLSGRSFNFTIGAGATGSEVKERVAELIGIQASEGTLLCENEKIEDDDLVLETHRKGLMAAPPQLKWVRMFTRRAMSCSTDCTLKLWNLDRGVCDLTLRGHGDGVICMDVDWAMRCALSSSHDSTLRLWDLDHGICVLTIRTPEHPAFCLAADFSAEVALTGSWDHRLMLWDLKSASCIRIFEGHDGLVRSCSLHWQSQKALSCAYDQTLRLWDVETGSCIRTFSGHTDQVHPFDVDWHAEIIASGSSDRTLRMWSLSNEKCDAILRGHQGSVTSVALNADSGMVVSAAEDKTIKLWNSREGVCVINVRVAATVFTLSVDWQASRVLTGCNISMDLWDVDTVEHIQKLSGHTECGGIGHVEAASHVLMNRCTY